MPDAHDVGGQHDICNNATITGAARYPVWHEADQHDWRVTSAPASGAVDVAIVGGGFSGLWTAYYFSLARPEWSIAVFESSRIGFGASGRNGGWCSGTLALSPSDLAETFGRDAALLAYTESYRTLNEIEAVLSHERISCGWHRGGSLTSATIPLQRARLQHDLAKQHAVGVREADLRWLSAEETRAEMELAETYGAVYTPHCATVNPFQMVLGLARVLRQRGVQLWESSPVSRINDREVQHTANGGCGVVRAGLVVQATEAYSPSFRQTRRTVLPLYSLMVATEPLPRDVLVQLKWSRRATFTDGSRMIIYAQLTNDGRLAIGGRGAPYHFRSRVHPSFDIDDETHDRIVKAIARHLPPAAGARITHRWGGAVGVPRDWIPSVVVDRERGYARIGGYTGDGVACTNLLARAVVDEWLQRDTSLRRLPFIGHHSPQWEVEPLRFVAVNSLIHLSNSIDTYEASKGRIPKLRTALIENLL